MRKTILTLLLLGIGFSLTVLAKKKIYGKVLERNTLKPLSAANVYIPHTFIGTLTDSLGVFEIEIPDKYMNDSLYFSYLGYHEVSFPISHADKKLKVLLENNAQSLNEVVVYPIDPNALMDSVRKYLYENHYTEPMVQTGYMCEAYFEKGQCIHIGEAAYNNYLFRDNGQYVEIVKYLKARNIIDSTALQLINDVFRLKKDTVRIETTTFLDVSGLFNVLHFIDTSLARKKKDGIQLKANFRYLGTKSFFNNKAHELEIDLSYKKHLILTGTIFIDLASYAVAAYKMYSPEGVDLYRKIFPWKVRIALKLLGYKIRFTGFQYQSNFRKYKKKWLTDYSKISFSIRVTKKNKTADGFIISEYFILKNQIPDEYPDKDYLTNKMFKEDFPRLFTNEYWTPYPYIELPKKYRMYITEIRKRNKNFEGSIKSLKKRRRKKKSK